MGTRVNVSFNSADITIKQLSDMINDGDLNTNPDFQRDYVYKDKQASKLVESILLGIPIPNVFFCQEDDESFSVIDGQQRIVSLTKFLNNELKLTGLEEIKEYNGLKYKDLPKDEQRKYKNTTLNCIKILKENKNLKYEIFTRLNQGAVKLKPQELRNCIYRGSFNSLLEEMAKKKKEKLKKLFFEDNNNKKYQEYILRFFALRDFSQYKGSLLKTMNEFMELHKNEPKENIKKIEKEFFSVFDIVKSVLGNQAFCAYDRSKKVLMNKFSPTVYDSIMIAFSFFDKRGLQNNADKIKKEIKKIKTGNREYQDASYGSSGSKSKVLTRISIIFSLLQEYVKETEDKIGDRRLYSKDEKIHLWNMSKKHKCCYCGQEILSIDNAEVDHSKPYSKGGKTNLKNAKLIHSFCNKLKSNKVTKDNNKNWEVDE